MVYPQIFLKSQNFYTASSCKVYMLSKIRFTAPTQRYFLQAADLINVSLSIGFLIKDHKRICFERGFASRCVLSYVEKKVIRFGAVGYLTRPRVQRVLASRTGIKAESCLLSKPPLANK